MIRVAKFACLAMLALSIRAEGFGPSLTVLLDFDSKPAGSSINELRREVTQLMRPTGYRVDVQMKSELPSNQEFEDVVIVRFRGSCDMAAFTPLLDERGSLAWTHTMQGEILPFSEVACDTMRRAVGGALWGSQRKKQDELFGRALGRVVAHELYHIVFKSNAHAKYGVFKESLSRAQLIADRVGSPSSEEARRALARWRRQP